MIGDARLAKGVKNKVFSIDLVSKDPSVIACDMSNVSLSSKCMIFLELFCLKLQVPRPGKPPLSTPVICKLADTP